MPTNASCSSAALFLHRSLSTDNLPLGAQRCVCVSRVRKTNKSHIHNRINEILVIIFHRSTLTVFNPPHARSLATLVLVSPFRRKMQGIILTALSYRAHTHTQADKTNVQMSHRPMCTHTHTHTSIHKL